LPGNSHGHTAGQPTDSPEASSVAAAWRTRLQDLCFGLGAVVTALVIRLSVRGIPDPDSFYHFRHAALYAERGLTMSAFPWLVQSVVSRYASDLGYGFHVLLIPFTRLSDPVLGAKLATAFEIALVMGLCYWVMRRQAIAYAAAWPFMLIFFSPAIVYTVTQTRPQTLLMGFAMPLLSFLMLGGPWGVFGASAAISFFHLNAAAVVPGVVAVAAVVKGIVERRWEWRTWIAAAVGLGLGWVLRPNPIGSAHLLYLQTIVHEVARQRHLPLLFGGEWSPMPAAALLGFSYFLLIWAAAILVFLMAEVRRHQSLTRADRSFLWTSLLLSLVCFAAALVVSKRTVPLWAAFSVLFVAKAFTMLLNASDRRPGQLLGEDARLTATFGIAVLLGVMIWSGASQVLVQKSWPSRDPQQMKGPAQWIASQAKPNDIVFNVNWDAFPELFFWNTRQRYVSGLDPVFLYGYNAGLYWEAHHLQTGEATARTWASPAAGPDGGEDVHAVLRRDFHASYLVLDKRRNQGLYAYLLGDQRFAMGFEDDISAVFIVKP